MRILFFAYTPFQTVTALAIKEKKYNNEECDIILADTIQYRDGIKKNIQKYGLFDNVYYGDINRYFNKKNKIMVGVNRIKAAFDSTYIGREIGINDYCYDCFLTTIINTFTESIYSLLRKYNKSVRVELMDEGYSSCTYYFREAYRPSVRKRRALFFLYRLPGRIMGRKYIAEAAKKLFLYVPELLCWHGNPYQIEKIEIEDDKVFLGKVNDLFGYNEEIKNKIEKEYIEQFIFFEESFYWNNGNKKDEVIIENIAQIVGKDNMMIKLHPRNLINRFKENGYKTNKTYGIPWEVIAINLPEEDNRVFLAVSSGAVLNYRFLKKVSFKTILLYKCLGQDYRNISNELSEWFEKYCKLYSDALYVPETKDDMERLLISLRRTV